MPYCVAVRPASFPPPVQELVKKNGKQEVIWASLESDRLGYPAQWITHGNEIYELTNELTKRQQQQTN